MTLLPKDYYLVPGNGAKNLLTKLYDVISVCQSSSTATRKLIKTIFHMYAKMELFFVFKMTHLKFVCVVSITTSAQVVPVIKVEI